MNSIAGVTYGSASIFLVLVFVCFCSISDLAIGKGESTGASPEFLAWIRSKNATINPNVEVKRIPHYGLGFVANSDLESGTVITKTPLHAVLSLEHAFLFPEFLPVMEGRLQDLSDTDLNALFLAFLRHYYRRSGNKDGAIDAQLDFSGYIQSLPSHVDLPLHFTDMEFEEMQGSAIADLCRRRNKAVLKVFKRILKTLNHDHPSAIPELVEDDFLWGLSVVWSRIHRVGAKDRNGQWQAAPALVPLADIFNMAPSEELMNVVCRTDDDSKHFLCSTTKPVSSGSQLLVLYSSAPHRHNGRLLMDYGFCLRDNPWDKLTFQLPKDVPTADPEYSRKHAVWTSIQPWTSGFILVSGPSEKEPYPTELLAVGRVFNLNGDILNALSGMKPQELYSFLLQPSKSAAVEKAAVRWASKAVQQALGKYRTTTSEDEATLESAELQPALRSIVTLRLGEKTILNKTLDAVDNYWQKLMIVKSKRVSREDL